MELYVIEGEAQTSREAISFAYQYLRDIDAVEESFLEACIEREREYPTGLPTEIPVAIPHTYPQHVKRPALCAVRLKDPVHFQCMGDPDESVEAQYIILMALKGAEDQLETLKKLMGVVQDRDLLEGWKTAALSQVREELAQRLEIQ